MDNNSRNHLINVQKMQHIIFLYRKVYKTFSWECLYVVYLAIKIAFYFIFYCNTMFLTMGMG